MLTLALDTATPDLSLALVTPQGTFASCERLERLHAQRIAADVQRLFEQAQLPLRADQVVVGIGPGSYTGVRVAASYALGLARAWNVPTLGVSTLKAMAASHEGRVAVQLDARRGNVYGALYQVTDGQVLDTLIPEAKHNLQDFSLQVAELGGQWVENPRVDAAALVRLAAVHGIRDWKLQYL